MDDLTEIELIEKAAVRVGMTSLLNHGAASCVYSEGCNGVTQAHLVAFAREVALHCVAALGVALPAPAQPPEGDWLWVQLMDWCKQRHVHPRDYNDLFAIVGRARALARGVSVLPTPRVTRPADPSEPDTKIAQREGYDEGWNDCLKAVARGVREGGRV